MYVIAFREALRRTKICVYGGNRWRNPDDDLPGDFDTAREVHYAALRQPLDLTEFVTDVRKRMSDALSRLDQSLVDGSAGVTITTRRGEPWITVPRLDALPEAVNLGKLKDEVTRRWGTLHLLNVLKDSDYLAEFTSEFISVASQEVIDRVTLRRRTWVSARSSPPASTANQKRRCDTCAGTSSPATTCAAPSQSW